MADLVAYQDSTIVSRTLVKQAAGTITLFAFAEGEALSEHTTPYDAVVHVVDGEAEVTIAAVTHRVRAGEVLRLPANEPHALAARCPFKMVLTMIRS